MAQEQRTLAAQVVLNDDFLKIRTVAGVDAGYDKERNLTKAVIAVLAYPSLDLLTSCIAYTHTEIPYIPGFLSFREMPAILRALSCLDRMPDLLMVDGQGIAHPRRLGIAAHLGVVTGLPSIGVAKSRLCGTFTDPANEEGARSILVDRDRQIGSVCRSRKNCRPLFISPGHRVSQNTAEDIVFSCLRGYRLPEPTRIADKISKWPLDRKTDQTLL